MTVDHEGVFARVLHDMIPEVFEAHGIDAITEDELNSIVAECYRKAYRSARYEMRKLEGRAVEPPRMGWGRRIR